MSQGYDDSACLTRKVTHAPNIVYQFINFIQRHGVALGGLRDDVSDRRCNPCQVQRIAFDPHEKTIGRSKSRADFGRQLDGLLRCEFDYWDHVYIITKYED